MPSAAEDFEPDAPATPPDFGMGIPLAQVVTPGADVPPIFRGTPREQEVARQGARDRPGEAASLARGVAQGVSLGFADELAGAVEAAATAKPYRQAREESRAAFARAAALHPTYYAAGLGGSALLPVPGAGGATLARSVLKAGALGGAAGLGASEADVTEPGGRRRAALDVGIGAGTAAGLSGLIGWRLRGAGERQLRGLIEDVNRGETAAKKSGRVALAVKAGGEEMTALRALQDRYPGPVRTIGAIARPKPEQGAKVADALVGRLAEENAPIYRLINTKRGGLPLVQLVADVDRERRAFVAAGKMDEAKALSRANEEIIATYGTPGSMHAPARLDANKKLPTETVRQIATGAGRLAFAGDISAPRSVKQAASEALRRRAVSLIEREARKAGVAAGDLDALRTRNKDMSLLITMRDNMAQRAADKQGGGRALTHTLQALGGGALTALASMAEGGRGLGTMAAGLSGAAAFEGGRRLLRLSDRGGAALVRAAKSGSDAARAVQGAAEVGIPRVAGQVAAGAVSRARREPADGVPIAPDDFEAD